MRTSDANALLLSQSFPTSKGNMQTWGVFIKSLADALSRLIDIELLCPRPLTPPIPGFPYYDLAKEPLTVQHKRYLVHRPRYLYLVPKSLFYHLAGSSYAWRVKAYASYLRRPTIIHSHWSYPDGDGALILGNVFDVPVVVHARGTLERVIAKKSPRWKRMVRRSLCAANAVITNCNALSIDCVDLGVEESRIHMIPDGVDTELFHSSDKVNARKKLGLREDLKKLVLYCGNLREVKGTHVLVEAIKRLSEKTVCSFVFVGAGEMEALVKRELYQEIGQGKVLMAGPRPYSEIPVWMNAADLLVLPSLSEARSNVIPEALACGTPIVASRVGGIPEVMRTDHGILVEPGNSLDLAKKISSIINDTERLEMMGAAGREFILKEGLTWKTHAKRTVDLYHELGG